MTVKTEHLGTALVVTMAAPPVNAIGHKTRDGLVQALALAARLPGLTRVILTGAGPAFAAGGDAREFDTAPLAPHLNEICAGIAASSVPWIAAINGVALGGGCELALACRYRIATPAARIGLPEVTLGVVPGAGGTQRLPRLIGLVAALELIATGKPVDAGRAEALGLIDGQADDPLAVALALDIGTLSLAAQADDLPAPMPDPDVVEAAHQLVLRKMPGQIAPLRAIELVAASTRTPLADGLAAERATFLDLRGSDQARALRHMFFAERAATRPAGLTAAPASLDRIAVVGGGTMGAGIAWAALEAGLSVSLLETDAEGVARARANIDKLASATHARGLADAARIAARLDRLVLDHDPACAAGATIAIEAASESLDVTRQVFAMLEAQLPPEAVLATTTTHLDIDQIAAGLADPARLVGLHFCAPAHVMKLLEILRAAATSDRALATGYALAAQLGKVPVVAGVCDGFIGNRILARYLEAADTLMMDGSNPWEIDEAMVAFGMAMGPYEAQDLSGLDIAFANRRRQDATRDPARRYIPISDRMVNEGRLGRKVGVGWYRYPGGGGKVIDPLVEDLAREEAWFAGVTQRRIDEAEIVERLVLAMVNEAAAILSEGIAARTSDIDLVTVLGYGFPRWRGGLMHHADTLGAAAIVARLSHWAEQDPLVWTPAPALLEAAKNGTGLAGHAA
jgi:3-hydroxyacyl-CoA dehydrogenase